MHHLYQHSEKIMPFSSVCLYTYISIYIHTHVYIHICIIKSDINNFRATLSDISDTSSLKCFFIKNFKRWSHNAFALTMFNFRRYISTASVKDKGITPIFLQH